MNKQNEKLKILHISRSMGQGGAQKVVYQLCMDNGDAKQYVASTGGEYVDELVDAGIAHYIIPDIDKKNPFMIVKTYFILLKIIRNEKIDIIHTHHRMAALYARLIQLTNHHVQHLYTAHNVLRDKKLLMRFALKNAKIVAVGEGVKNNLVGAYNISEKNITTIYNAVKPNKTECSNIQLQGLKNDGYFIVGSIGRLVPGKGFDIFIRAIKEVCSSKNCVMAVIIGDGEAKQALVNLSQSIGIYNRVTFLGFQNNILPIINQLDLVVSASRSEGLPLTPIETFSQGKTIIATNISGNNEIIKDGYNGLLFEKDNVSELARKIVLLLSDVGYREQLEQNAKDTYGRQYGYDKFIQQYMEVYRVLMKKEKSEKTFN